MPPVNLLGKYLGYPVNLGMSAAVPDGAIVEDQVKPISIPIFERTLVSKTAPPAPKPGPFRRAPAPGPAAPQQISRNLVANWHLKYLLYNGGRITETVLDRDILTGEMSGCYIVTYRRAGAVRVGHIGTTQRDKPGEDSEPTRKVKENWRRQIDNGQITVIGGFDPSGAMRPFQDQGLALRNEEYAAPHTFASVSADGKFAALLMFKVQELYWSGTPNDRVRVGWRVAKMLPVPSMPADEVAGLFA